MKIIFLKTVQNVGAAGEVKDVAEGFARNFLLPNKLAEAATAAALKRAKNKVDIKQHRDSKIVRDAGELLDIISKMVLTFKGMADEKGTLFSGITAEKISAGLRSKGLDMKAKQLKMDGALKKIGTHSVVVNLGGKQAIIKIVLARG
jgi:large subunit ribosomal protein L9